MLNKVGNLNTLPAGGLWQCNVGEDEVLVVGLPGRFVALAGRCTHAGAPLVEGTLEGEILTCPWHGSRFNVVTGAVIRGPAQEALPVYPVVVRGEDIFVDI